MEEKKPKVKARWTDFPLSKKLQKALKDNGFARPMPIQAKTLKAALIEDKHVFGAAQTGSGKTLAYAVPVIDSILKNRQQPCSLLKQKMCRTSKQKEDFDLIDRDSADIEEMIVDRELNDSDIEDVDPYSCDANSTDSEDVSGLDSSCPEAVVLVPTRELAVQVREEFEKLCHETQIKSYCIIGGLSQEKQLRLMKKLKPQIIIATPGRLFDIVQSDSLPYLSKQSLACIRALVIDEADRMVQKGHFQELMSILEIVNESKKFRNENFKLTMYLYSATLTFLHELPDRLRQIPFQDKSQKSAKAKKTPVKPDEHTKRNKIKRMIDLLGIKRVETKVIDLSAKSNFGRPSSDQLKEMKINCLSSEKDLYLYYFLVDNPNKRILVFCNSKDCLRRLCNVLKFLKIDTAKLHAEMDQKKRMSSLERFRKNKNLVLLATDVAARGLDIRELDCVIHYQVPRTCESYIHRSGRTARVNRTGVSLTLCEPKEAPSYKRLCNTINGGKDLMDYEINTKLRAMLQARVSLAQQCDKLDHHLRGKKSTSNWFMKAARDCDIELDEDELRRLSGKGRSKEENMEEDAMNRRRLASIQKRLNALLDKPVITRLHNKTIRLGSDT